MAAIWACVTYITEFTRDTLFQSIKFDSPCYLKKIRSALYLQNKKIEKNLR
jgi:hypothetical protein